MHRTNRWVSCALGAMVLSGSGVALADDAPAGAGSSAPAPSGTAAEADATAPAPSDDTVGTNVSVDWSTHYYFRGILQENEGAIVQPALSFALALHSGDGALSSVALTGGIWNSLHSGPTGAGGEAREASPNFGDPEVWYELDAYAGVTVGLGGLVTLGLTTTAYTSPNGMFATVWELTASAALDDSGAFSSALGGRFGGFQPSLAMSFELDGTAFGGESGRYGQVAIAPSLELFSSSAVRFTANVPITLGLGLGDYYESDAGDESAFGYLDTGLLLGTELAFVPARFGTVRVTAGGHLLALGDHLADRNAGDSIAVTANAGLALSH